MISSTISSLLSTPSSTPSSTSRWINGLFFSSLVVSLAAALFSIRAKQWIREFMKWNAPLAEPCENVMIRQIRFESWEEWNIDAFIWSIPSLLELAMVLFLAGVVILLWTLDSAVAIAITALVSTFLCAVSIITILPIFFKHCPYRSPTAWAFLRLWNVLWYSLCKCFFWMRNLLPHKYHGPRVYFRSNFNWRKRDQPSHQIGILNFLNIKAIHLELQRESTHLALAGSFVMEPNFWDVSKESSESFWFLLDVIGDISVLIRALQWVSALSQDDQVLQYIHQALDTIHQKQSLSIVYRNQDDKIAAGRALAVWCLLVARLQLKEEKFQVHLPAIIATSSLTHPDSITSKRQILGLMVERPAEQAAEDASGSESKKWICRMTDRFRPHISEDNSSIFPKDTMLLRYLESELGWLVAKDSWFMDDKQLRRVYEVMAVISHMTFDSWEDRGNYAPFDSDERLYSLRTILAESSSEYLSTYAPGLRTLAFYHAIECAKVVMSQNGTYSEL